MSEWTVTTTKEADKRLAAIPQPQRGYLEKAIDRLTKGPRESGLDVKPLKGRPEWRLRIGQWRVLFLVDRGKITITVVSVATRGDVYKK